MANPIRSLNESSSQHVPIKGKETIDYDSDELIQRISKLLEIPELKKDKRLYTFLNHHLKHIGDLEVRGDSDFIKFLDNKLSSLLTKTGKVNKATRSALLKKKRKAAEVLPMPSTSTRTASKNATETGTSEEVLPPPIPLSAFGMEDWESHIGRIEGNPPLPRDIDQLLKSTCPFWPDETIGNTHFLTLIPKKVRGKPLTIARINSFFTRMKGGHKAGFIPYLRSDSKLLNQPVSDPYWVLITRRPIPKSFGKTAKEHRELINACVGIRNLSYEIPSALDMSVSVLMEFVRSGKVHYVATDSSHHDFRCQDIDFSSDPEFPAIRFSGYPNDSGVFQITRTYLEEGEDDMGVGAMLRLKNPHDDDA